jgi:hypothetical protein
MHLPPKTREKDQDKEEGYGGTWNFWRRHIRICGLRLYSFAAFDKACDKETFKG